MSSSRVLHGALLLHVLAAVHAATSAQLKLIQAIAAENHSSTAVADIPFEGDNAPVLANQVSFLPFSPAVFNTSELTGRHSLISADLHVHVLLTNTHLLIFNTTSEQLVNRLVYSKALQGTLACDPRYLTNGRSVHSSGDGQPAIALIVCESKVYGLFPRVGGGFEVEKRLDTSRIQGTHNVAVVHRSNGDTKAVFFDSQAGFIVGSSLGAGAQQVLPLFPLDVECHDPARTHPYGTDRFLLNCSNSLTYLCTTVSCGQQLPRQSQGEELAVAYNRDIAVRATNSSSVTVYQNSFTEDSCSLNIPSPHFDLAVTPEAVILVVIGPNNVHLYNITSGCNRTPIASLNLTTECLLVGCAVRNIQLGQYFIITSSNISSSYNVSVVDLHSGNVYTAHYTKPPLVYLNVISTTSPLPTSPSISPLQSPFLSPTPSQSSLPPPSPVLLTTPSRFSLPPPSPVLLTTPSQSSLPPPSPVLLTTPSQSSLPPFSTTTLLQSHDQPTVSLSSARPSATSTQSLSSTHGARTPMLLTTASSVTMGPSFSPKPNSNFELTTFGIIIAVILAALFTTVIMVVVVICMVLQRQRKKHNNNDSPDQVSIALPSLLSIKETQPIQETASDHNTRPVSDYYTTCSCIPASSPSHSIRRSCESGKTPTSFPPNVNCHTITTELSIFNPSSLSLPDPPLSPRER